MWRQKFCFAFKNDLLSSFDIPIGAVAIGCFLNIYLFRRFSVAYRSRFTSF